MADSAASLFKEIPEFLEVEIAESLTARTETLITFRELGPPDLCHTLKTTGRSGQKDIGSYHYVSGVDASSSASLAAYLNSLTYAIEETGAWFSKASTWKVRHGTYCCFNAFSRVDVRVDVKIPGGVTAYVVDLRGEKHEPTPEIWLETYLSALLRAILYADDPSYKLIGYRKLEPITSHDSELKFLQAAEALFLKGWQLGSDPEVQVACPTANHLVTGLLKYFGESFRFDKVANLFEKIAIKEPEVIALLAKSYIGMNEEVKAVQIISTALKNGVNHYALLHVQCDFLRSKGKYEWALEVAKQAVNCAPSEFSTWAKLTEVYVDLGMHESALLTLNSCPMFTVNDRDLHKMPTPWKTHLPIKPYIEESGILEEHNNSDETDVALQRLPAPSLKGTFARAYSILAKLVSQIGWDELLKARSNVFVMEEEYRMQKAFSETTRSAGPTDSARSISGEDSAVVMEDGTILNRAGGGGYASQIPSARKAADPDDNASTRALVPNSPDLKATTDDEGSLSSGIPVIKVSSESDREREHAMMASVNGDGGETNGVEKDDDDVSPETVKDDRTPTIDEVEDANKNGEEQQPKSRSFAGQTIELEKPVQAATPVVPEHQDLPPSSPNPDDVEEGFSFANKRLCERWLDNLFMCLYEDLRIWTIFRAEVAHFKTHHLAYRKNSSEWEILGELGLRLHHKEEAKDAFQRCLDGKFSAKAWLRLLEMYAEEGDLQRSLNAAIRLTVYNQRWYMETAYPSAVASHLYKLCQIHGHAKISYTLLSLGLPEQIQKSMEGYMRYGSTFQVEGYDF